jgi:homopolymeric O-antigen transport system permease protein
MSPPARPEAQTMNVSAMTPAKSVTFIRPSRGLFDLDLGAVWRYRELLFYLVWREVKIRYKQAALGVAWAVLQPLFTVLIFTAIFGMFARFPSDGLPYPVFALAAVLPWTYFAEALRRSATGLVTDAELVRKIYFPRLIVPVAGASSPLVDFFFGMIVLLGLMAWYGVHPGWALLAAPLWLAESFCLALALGLWLGPINVRYRDIMHTLPFVIQVWMFASPIVYPLSMIPEKWRALYSLNPVVGIVEGFRWSLLGTGRPDLTAVGIGVAVIAIVLLSGIVYFRKTERSFADVI